jgi:hypothetical protein
VKFLVDRHVGCPPAATQPSGLSTWRELTWNCSHIANATMRRAIDDACVANGYRPTVLCTPEELMEE